MNLFKVIGGAILILVFVGGWFIFGNKPGGYIPSISQPPATQAPRTSPARLKDSEDKENSQVILYDVPFVSQAPTGNWNDPRQQDGCEEAAAFMTMLWVKGEKAPITSQEKEQKLLAISDYQQKQYGGFHDTSVADTVERIFKGYFQYNKVEARHNIMIQDIISELKKGNLIIVPANGQKLANPFFTSPGPERHNLVIRGYDPNKKEFITNDNGTQRGELYRYDQQLLFNAIRDYPTGDHLPLIEENKAMIVVKP